MMSSMATSPFVDLATNPDDVTLSDTLFTQVDDEQQDTESGGTFSVEYALIPVGIVGVIANGVVLIALLSRNLRTKKTNSLLILNQVTLDFYSSVMLVVTYAVTSAVSTFRPPWGEAVCRLVVSQFLLFIGVHASITSLAMITIERFAKIVLYSQYKKYFRKWMIAAAVVICMLSGILNTFTTAFNFRENGGSCDYVPTFFSSYDVAKTYALLLIVWHYFVPLAIFIYCYGHILVVVRRSNKISHDQTTTIVSGSQPVPRGQLNIIKTLIIVSVVFALCWFINNVVYLISVLDYSLLSSVESLGNIATIIGFLNMSINPFMYAVNHKVVKAQVVSMFCPAALKRCLGGGGREVSEVKPSVSSSGGRGTKSTVADHELGIKHSGLDEQRDAKL